jgi:hypothetical protein
MNHPTIHFVFMQSSGELRIAHRQLDAPRRDVRRIAGRGASSGRREDRAAHREESWQKIICTALRELFSRASPNKTDAERAARYVFPLFVRS